MAEQTLNERPERLAADFDGTELAEVFPTSQGISYKTSVGTAIAMNNGSGGSTLGTAAVATVGTATTEVPTNSQRDGRDNTFTGDNSFVGSRYVPVTVTSDHTIAGESELIVNTDATTTVAITIPSGLPIGTRKKISRIGVYDTTNTNRVRLLPSGTEYITAGQLTDVPIYGNGGNWEIQKVGSLRWEIVGGYDRGSNSKGRWERLHSGRQINERSKSYAEITIPANSASTLESNVSTTLSIPFIVSSSAFHVGGNAGRFVCQIEGGDEGTTWGGLVLLSNISTTSRTVTPILRFLFTGQWYQEV